MKQDDRIKLLYKTATDIYCINYRRALDDLMSDKTEGFKTGEMMSDAVMEAFELFDMVLEDV